MPTLLLLLACRAAPIPPIDPPPTTGWTPPAVPCDATTTADLGAVPPADTAGADTALAPACPESVGEVVLRLCVETDAPVAPAPVGATTRTHAGSAEITAVGEDLPTPAGSAPFPGFDDCGPGRQAQLVDAGGATWTLAWTSDDPAAPDPTAALVPGTAVHFDVRHTTGDLLDDSVGLLVADASGPLVFHELGRDPASRLTDAERGAISIASGVGYGEACWEHSEAVHDLLHVGWCGGSAALRSGSSIVAPAAGGDVELFALVDATFGDGDCFAGCDRESWVAWRR